MFLVVSSIRTCKRDGSQVVGILNKISPENIVALSRQLVDFVHIQPGETNKLVVAVARKSYKEPKFSETYAK